MGYKYRNDETPDHVDSSDSDPSYPHVGIPIVAADATRVGKPNFDKLKEQQSLKSKSDKNYEDANDILSGKRSSGGGIDDVNDKNQDVLVYQKNSSKKTSDSLSAEIDKTKKDRSY